MRKLHILFLTVITVFLVFGASFNSVKAEAVHSSDESADTGYDVCIIDDASLFSETEKDELLKALKPFTEYGNALVATASVNDCATVKQLAIKYYDKAFGTEDGAVFLFDMDNREIYWYTEGSLYDSISVKSAMVITDNVYSYASDGDFVKCAGQAFDMAVTVIKGGRIRQSMKLYGNALLAVILAIFINYVIARRTSFIRANYQSEEDIQSNMELKQLSSTEISTSANKTVGKKWFGSVPTYSGNYSSSDLDSSYSSDSGSSYSLGSSDNSYSSGSSHSAGSGGSYSSGGSGSSSSHRGGGAGHRF